VQRQEARAGARARRQQQHSAEHGIVGDFHVVPFMA
jgi:hypothetical protein